MMRISFFQEAIFSGFMFRDEVAVVFDFGGGLAFELGIDVEVDVVEAEVGLVVEGVTPLAIGREGPTEISADGDAFLTDLGHFVEVNAEVFLAGDAIGEGDAAVFDDHDFLFGKPTMIAAHGVTHPFGPDGGVEEAALAGFDEAVQAVKLTGGQAPIVIHADEVERLMGFGRTKTGGKFAAHSEIPPVGVGDESNRSRKAPEEIEFAGFGLENFKGFVVIEGDELDLVFVIEDVLGDGLGELDFNSGIGTGGADAGEVVADADFEKAAPTDASQAFALDDFSRPRERIVGKEIGQRDGGDGVFGGVRGAGGSAGSKDFAIEVVDDVVDDGNEAGMTERKAYRVSLAGQVGEEKAEILFVSELLW